MPREPSAVFVPPALAPPALVERRRALVRHWQRRWRFSRSFAALANSLAEYAVCGSDDASWERYLDEQEDLHVRIEAEVRRAELEVARWRRASRREDRRLGGAAPAR